MKRVIIALFFLASCAGGGKAVTVDSYYAVSIGMSEKELFDTMGEPYYTKNLDNDEVEYEYIEKIDANSKVMQVRNYFFVVKNGKVKSKRIKQKNRPAYMDSNSYDMQTSYN